MNTAQRIRITEPGWESFTGPLAGIAFENALSVDAVAPAVANHIGSMIRVEAVDDAAQVGASSVLLQHVNTRATVVAESDRVEKTEVVSQPFTSTTVVAEYTREDLEAIADKEGIAGLRAIAEPMGVKGRGIAELLTAILAVQAQQAAG